VSSSDGDTEQTELTIVQSDILLSKDQGAYAQKNAVGGGTHDARGWYSLALDDTDTATVGNLRIYVHVSGALPVWEDFTVVTAEVFDATITGNIAEIESAPAANAPLPLKIGWLFALARNKRTTTDDTETLYNDAGDTAIATAGVSDDNTTFTRNEWSS
jgi:hypothetical protein